MYGNRATRIRESIERIEASRKSRVAASDLPALFPSGRCRGVWVAGNVSVALWKRQGNDFLLFLDDQGQSVRVVRPEYSLDIK